MKQSIGPLICLFGLLLALTTAAKPPVAAGKWPDTLPYTLGSCGLALAGLLLWRRQPHPLWAETDLTTDQKESQSPERAEEGLEPCVTALQGLLTTLPTLTITEIAAELETLYTQHLLPLSQRHKQFMTGETQEEGLERLALFSQGELWINRARSAAGDRHREETIQSLEWAMESLLAVQQRMAMDNG